MRKAIVLNGPPGSGKDLIASLIMKYHYIPGLTTRHYCFKENLFKDVSSYYQIDDMTWFMNLYNNRDTKDKPVKSLDGKSPRQALIHVAEKIIKPQYGQSYYGLLLAKQIPDDTFAIISDGGFIKEVDSFCEKIGYSECALIRVNREGYEFGNDSRNYISMSYIKNGTINNNGSLTDLCFEIEDALIKLNMGVEIVHR